MMVFRKISVSVSTNGTAYTYPCHARPYQPGRRASFFQAEKPTQVYLAAAKVGGILANNTYPADFIYRNLMMQVNVR